MPLRSRPGLPGWSTGAGRCGRFPDEGGDHEFPDAFGQLLVLDQSGALFDPRVVDADAVVVAPYRTLVATWDQSGPGMEPGPGRQW